MLRVRTIYAHSAGAAVDYYTRYLTEAPGEIPGKWHGQQATGLGLAGDVAADDLLALLEGRDPRTGTPLGRALADRQLANGTIVKAVAGFDATFSAPKSLSVLWALTRDTRLLEAHDVAVNAALAHIERYGSSTRVRVAGGRRLHPDSQGLTIATFRQTTSRSADDPQIHTHCVISAKVQTEDGRWLALDARYLKKHQRVLGGLYQSVLRNELTHRFGIAWGDIEKGQAEMSAMPNDLLGVFSKRSDQIDAELDAKIADFLARQGRDPNQWELGAIKREAAVTREPTSRATACPPDDTVGSRSGRRRLERSRPRRRVRSSARRPRPAARCDLTRQPDRRPFDSRLIVEPSADRRSRSPTSLDPTHRSPATSGPTESRHGPTP